MNGDLCIIEIVFLKFKVIKIRIELQIKNKFSSIVQHRIPAQCSLLSFPLTHAHENTSKYRQISPVKRILLHTNTCPYGNNIWEWFHHSETVFQYSVFIWRFNELIVRGINSNIYFDIIHKIRCVLCSRKSLNYS